MADNKWRGPVLMGVLLFGLSAAAAAQTGSITVLKNASADDGTEFPFELQGPSGLEEFALEGGESAIFDDLPAGSYTVTEEVPPDWELSAIACGIFFAPGPVASGALQFELAEGEDTVCQFFNSSLGIPPPPPPADPSIPTLSPTGVAILFMALAAAGGALISRLR